MCYGIIHGLLYKKLEKWVNMALLSSSGERWEEERKPIS
jgi:hypothetical protein